MTAFSSALSITAHVAIGAAALFGTARSGRSDPARPVADTLFFQPAPVEAEADGGLPMPGPIRGVRPDIPFIPLSTTLPQTHG